MIITIPKSDIDKHRLNAHFRGETEYFCEQMERYAKKELKRATRLMKKHFKRMMEGK